MDGTAAAGASALYSRGDHVHPTDTSRYAASNPSGYQTAAQVTTALTPYATLAAPVFTGDARAVTPAAGDADTSIATTAFVAATLPNTNFADNTGFAINQRTYVSGTALAAAAFGHDRWKGGAGGGTYTFAAPAGPANTITITVGTLQQVVEGLGIAGGNYMLSWTGTAQGRVGAGSYAASPVSVAGIVAGTNTTIEFNTGTLSRVKFEAGTVATPWQVLDYGTDLQRCQRFYQVVPINLAGYTGAGTGCNVYLPFPVPMRGTPIATPTFTTQSNCGSSAVYVVAGFYQPYTVGTAAGGYTLSGSFTASADL